MGNRKMKIFKNILVMISIVFVIYIVGCSTKGNIKTNETSETKETNGIVVFQSDFGLKDGAVSAMKGVALNVDNSLKLYDITHDIPPFKIWDASYRLNQTCKYWPSKTVFVSIVDPGVGSERLSVVAKLKNGSYIVTPDNGTLTLMHNEIEEIREIDESKNRLEGSEESLTFHGRDVYAYTAARLASGTIQFKEVGNLVNQKPVVFEYKDASLDENSLSGMIEMLDVQYGNVWTNIGNELAKKFGMEYGKEYNVLIKNDGKNIFSSKVKYVKTFSDVPKGEPLIYLNSLLKVSLAINSGSFADKYGVSYGEKWSIEIKPVK